MSERLRALLSDLRDEHKYKLVPQVRVFDEHAEVYYVNADGEPCGKDEPGAKKKVRKFGRNELKEIARRCNRRDLTGSLAPLTFGHTVSGQPEEKQPRPRGYATNYSVGYDGDLKRHVLKADFYVRKKDYAEATTYPRVSIELWPDHGVIDPIALLRRTPQRDLGQWHYDRAGRSVLRYQMESPMAKPNRYAEDEELFSDDGAGDAPPELPEGPDADGADGEPDGDEEAHERYMRHCASHPDRDAAHRYQKAKYGMAEEMPGEGMDGDMPDPTDSPDADMPLKNAMPSATNSGLGKYGRDAAAVRYARLEQEVGKLRKEANEAKAAAIVTQLVAEGYMIDADEEVLAFAKLGEPERKKREGWIRKNGRKAPTGVGYPVAERNKAGESADLSEDPEALMRSPADLAKVMQYQRQHGLYDAPLHELAAKVFPNKYGRREG